MSTECNYFCEPEKGIHALVVRYTGTAEQARNAIGRVMTAKHDHHGDVIKKGTVARVLSMEDAYESDLPLDDKWQTRQMLRLQVLT